MRDSHASTAGISLEIAKGWKPSLYLSNLAMAFFQDPGVHFAKDIFPLCPVSFSSGQYYIFNKAEMAKDQVGKKPAFGKVSPAVFSHTEAPYSCSVDQFITGIDQISALNYQRANVPAAVDPRRNKVRMASEQMNLHLDRLFAEKYFTETAWENVKSGGDTADGSATFGYFDDASSDIIGQFDDYKRDILLNGLRLPTKLLLGYKAYVAMKNHPQFLERVTGSGSTPNPALVNEQVIATVLGIPTVKVIYAVQNTANLGQKEKMEFVCDENAALLCYAPDAPSIEEPSAGYIFTWDMLGNGQWIATDSFQGDPGTHTEFVESLLSTDMRKTCDDLAIFMKGCVKK